MIKKIFVLFAVAFMLSGCADIEVPTAGSMLKSPLGESGLNLGMTKTQVTNIYGTPDEKNKVTSKDWNAAREEWVYRARYSAIPVNAGFLAEDLYLYFDADSLTNISKKPLGEKYSEVSENKDDYIK